MTRARPGQHALAVGLLVYIVCAFSGVAIERRLPLNSLLKRTMLILGVAAGQLMLSIQGLSLGYALNLINLLIANAALTAVVVFCARRLTPNTTRLPWRELIGRARFEFRALWKDLPAAGVFAVAVALFMLAAICGWMVVPFNDSYHFEMPRFWMQRETILPFPVSNPRITTLSFLSEAIHLPAYFLVRSDRVMQVGTIIAGLLVAWTIFSLSQRLRASFVASICTAALSFGLSAFAGNLFQAGAEMLLAGAFLGASLVFLMDLAVRDTNERFPAGEFAGSVFLFVMACGAKNATTVLGPIYLLILCVSCWRNFAHRHLWRFTVTLALSGFVGLLCSGVAWNYTANKLWFGQKGVPRLIAETISHNFHPREIWTRIARGGVLFVYDTMWVPKSVRPRYEAVCESTLKFVGVKSVLPEDRGFYSFKPAPNRGLGLLGLAGLTPALLFALVRFKRLPTGARSLLILAVAAFLLAHVILRWQSVGVLRLMFPFVVVAAPLMALLLERKSARVVALALLLVTSALHSVYWIGVTSRRMNLSDRPFFNKIARLQNDHTSAVQYQWKDQPMRDLIIREDFTRREVDEMILRGLKQPATIGVIGDGNTELIHLFGRRSRNEIISLVDAREEEKILDLPLRAVDYVVVAEKFPQAKDWARVRGLEQILTCKDEKGEVALVYENPARAKR